MPVFSDATIARIRDGINNTYDNVFFCDIETSTTIAGPMGPKEVFVIEDFGRRLPFRLVPEKGARLMQDLDQVNDRYAFEIFIPTINPANNLPVVVKAADRISVDSMGEFEVDEAYNGPGTSRFELKIKLSQRIA